MVSSTAQTVSEYLASLSPEKALVIRQMREFILQHLPQGYEETMNWGMISYEVPLSVFPETYNKQPLMYAALAAQKNHNSLYLTPAYMSEDSLARLLKGYADEGLKVDMGKSCLRFKKMSDLPMQVIGQIIAEYPMTDFIAAYQRIRPSK